MFGVKQVVAVALWGGLVVGSAGCGGDRTGEAATTSTPTTAVETPPSTLDPETEVEQAYLAFDAMLTRLRQDPNPADPEIGERTAGQTRDALVGSQTTARTTGKQAKFFPGRRVEVLDVSFVDEGLAVVRSCVAEGYVITGANGVSTSHEVATFWTDYTLRLDGNLWRVISSEAVAIEEGEQPCRA